MRQLLYKLAELIGYTIIIEDTLDFETWKTTKWTHIVIYKYLGRWRHDNSIKLRRVWSLKLRNPKDKGNVRGGDETMMNLGLKRKDNNPNKIG